MRVWIDLTNSPHVVFFRPLVELLRARAHQLREADSGRSRRRIPRMSRVRVRHAR